MSRHREGSPEELEDGRASRVAHERMGKLEISVSYLQQAGRLRKDAGLPVDDALEALISRSINECMALKEKSAGRRQSRRRPKKRREPSNRCFIYLDECGQHNVAASDAFAAFVLAAVIVREADLDAFGTEWSTWKTTYLGGADRIVHEPELRHRRPPFAGDAGEAAASNLPEILGDLPYKVVSVVIHRPDFVADFSTDPIDESLPSHAYLVALDFLLERLVFALESEFDGALGCVIAESRGTKEDAQLQHELSRLQLEGTSYIHPSWFRQQLQPGILFLKKSDNSPGLQVADLAARPIGEKVIDPDSSPPRWDVFRDKLCHGSETKNSIVGLKIMPWRDRFDRLWES